MRPDAPVPWRAGDVLWTQIVVGLYGPISIAAIAWIVWWDGVDAMSSRTFGGAPVRDVSVGIAVGLALVVATRIASRLGWLGGLERSIAEHIGPLRPLTCIVLAAGSSIGEELVFRAILQESWGLAIASLSFAAAHVPVEKSMATWPAFALIAGLLFGGLYAWSGAALAGIVAHFVVNAVNLRWLAERAEPT